MITKENLFWFCALLGSGSFLIQILFAFFVGHEDDFDYSFKWLSKQAVTGFLMMFGWVGLSCILELKFPLFLSTLIALFAGLISVLITALIFKGAQKLRSTGTIFKLEEAIGKQAFVYQRIPKGGLIVGAKWLILKSFK